MTIDFKQDFDEDDLDDKAVAKIYLTQAINGIFAFIGAYLIVMILYQLASMVMGTTFSMRGTWFYYLVAMEPIDGHWTRKAIVASYAAGPIMAFVLAILALVLYFNVFRYKSGITKLLLVWIFIHGINLSLGNVVVGAVLNYLKFNNTYRGAGHALVWSRIEGITLMITAGSALVVQLIAGFMSFSIILQTALSRRLLFGGSGARFKYLLTAVFLPWVVGTLIILLIKVPHVEPFDLLIFAILGTIVIAILSLYGFNTALYMSKNNWRTQTFPNVSLILVTGALLFFYRVVLGLGIPF
ncbi:MAG: hypothetical protein ACOVMN_09900 [Flexibacteraceae bacterium]